MGVQDQQPVQGLVVSAPDVGVVEGKVATDNNDVEPLMGVEAVNVQTVEVVDPSVGHFWPACIGTFFCHLMGLGLTLICCPSSYGKAGAATGFAFSALKLSIVALMGAMIVSHYHVPHAFYPDELKTAEACKSYRGLWVPMAEPKTTRHAPSEFHFSCQCPPLFLAPREEGTGRVVCVDSQRFWIKVSILASVMFYLFSVIARYYLRNSSPTTQVTVVSSDTPAVVVHEEKMVA